MNACCLCKESQLDDSRLVCTGGLEVAFDAGALNFHFIEVVTSIALTVCPTATRTAFGAGEVAAGTLGNKTVTLHGAVVQHASLVIIKLILAHPVKKKKNRHFPTH